MVLEKYRNKRNFDVTSEPRGRKKAGDNGVLRFVVQQHHASRMHYDFRLEFDGVLKSWAVPKGPCLDPTEKRLAVQVEDHPIAYIDFEGVIPEGQYGAGEVIVWDTGTWESEFDIRQSFRKGHLVFTLNGKKLKGGWSLVKMAGGAKDRDNWLLIKQQDKHARPLEEDILLKKPKSVLSSRTIDEIGEENDGHGH